MSTSSKSDIDIAADAKVTTATRRPVSSDTRRWILRYVRSRPRVQLGLAIVLGFGLLAVIGPWIVPFQPDQPTPNFLTPPSTQHWFGTTRAGLDVFSRVVVAARIDILIAVSSAFVSLIVGTTFGLIAGFSRGVLGEVISRVSDVVQAFPFVILALVLLAALGPSVPNLVAVIALVNTPIYLRLIKSQTLQLRDRTFVEAAHVAGASRAQLMFSHLLPNAVAPAYAQLSINVAWAMLLTAGVSFLGAGVRPPQAEWGLMIAEGASDMVTGAWWVAVFPGVALVINTFGYALLADGLSDLADPRRSIK